MYFLYSALLTIGLIAASPLLLIDALRKGKYVTGLSQRLGNVPQINSNNLPVIWLHCVSVGETTTARTLVKTITERFPSSRIVISTTTITGQKVARELFGKQAVAIFYFPIDWAWTVRRVIRSVRPAAVLLMETELWPRLIRECRVRQIPLFLVNGRISHRSFRRYKLVRRFIARVLNDLTLAFGQSERDAQRLRELGLPASRILAVGNLKFDCASICIDEKLSTMLRERFAFNRGAPLIVAGSTHEPEERVVIEAFKIIRNQRAVRLLIAPRHPERFARVVSILAESGLRWVRRSDEPAPSDAGTEVVLLDSIGELRAAYSLADIAFVGGSIASHGGHNVLEPAALGICVVTGPYTQNFAAVTKALLEDDAIVQLPQVPISEAVTQLASALVGLLDDQTRRAEIAQRAKTVCRRNMGATERTVDAITTLLYNSFPRETPAISSFPATVYK